MSFTNIHDLETFQRELRNAGYVSLRDPVDISDLVKGGKVIDCEIIARKDFYNILYMEAESNWRGIATDVVKKNKNPCLVITAYKETHIILSTMRDHVTHHTKPRYVVIDTESNTHSLNHFIKLIKATQDDDFISIDTKVQAAFDEFSTYKQAIDEFGKHLEVAIRNTRDIIIQASTNNKKYDTESEKFLEMCRKVISNKLELGDITELLLQHVMTYRIFALIYDEHELHTTNAIARSLEGLMNTLEININTVSTSYKTIELVAESITDATEKQDFLKQVYETFYAKYDPKNKDSWGIAYTPSEVVDFMVRSTEYLLEKHFKNSLSDDNVTILDPATGTGTFVTSILRHLKPDSLEAKYKNDIFANDISILAYYIAALNIENTYQEITGKIKEFENICWMDTLTSGTKDFGKLSAYIDGQDNVKRISRQQQKDICVVLGNPPYNAVQVSFNDANPAEKYPDIDEMIQEDYYNDTKVQNKNKSFDMYKRFLKWSSERIKENGMIVFVSNNSFLDAKADAGMRQALYDEFDYIYTINLKGNSKLEKKFVCEQGENVFNVRVGIAISFFVKTGSHSEIQYVEIPNNMKKEDKLEWLDKHSVSVLEFKKIIPDKDAVWLNQTNNDFETLLPILPREYNESIFKISTPGVGTNKDEWVYSIDKSNLQEKMKYYVKTYNNLLKKYKTSKKITNLTEWVDKKIKWSRGTVQGLQRKHALVYSNDKIKPTLYRPFIIRHQYYDNIVTDQPRRFHIIFKNSTENLLILFTNPKTNVTFNTLGTNLITGLDCITGTQNIPFWIYDNNAKKQHNITKYALDIFHEHYKNKKITQQDIFYYVYGIFNDPKYEQKYSYDLQRHFPRIPLTKNFKLYSTIGKQLFNLHCNFNDIHEYELKREDTYVKKNQIRLSLKDDEILIDNITILKGIPKEIFDYKLGSINPLEWILKYYKDSKNQISNRSSNDENICKKFNTYKFEDHKEELIMLLKKVTTVCVETVKLRKELEQLEWGSQPKLKLTPINKKSIKESKLAEIKTKTKKESKSKVIKPKKTKSANIDGYV